jgi:hypothetical protein
VRLQAAQSQEDQGYLYHQFAVRDKRICIENFGFAIMPGQLKHLYSTQSLPVRAMEH